jgi:polyphosphate glucokinase
MRNVIVIDVGGTHVKIRTSTKKHGEFASGPSMTPRQMVDGVKKLAQNWKYDAVSIGYPGPVRRGQVVSDPHNLGKGWVDFNFKAAFNCPVKILNDAAMQALGGYDGGNMLFLGLGTGLGSCMIVDGTIVPMELAHLRYKNGTYEDCLGIRGVKALGTKKWRKKVVEIVEVLRAAFEPEDIVLGGGNVHRLKKLPKGCRAGDNANAFVGGLRLWEDVRRVSGGQRSRPPVRRGISTRNEKTRKAD